MRALVTVMYRKQRSERGWLYTPPDVKIVEGGNEEALIAVIQYFLDKFQEKPARVVSHSIVLLP